jgi:Zn-dependent M28 family amino/carboxypeptidase
VRERTAFDGQRALGYVEAQLRFGPRVPGTPAARGTGDWIAAEMRRRADTVVEQRWSHVTQTGDTLPLRNILARFKPDAAERVLFVTHWDSPPHSNEAEDPAERNHPVPGANDGASGVALFVALGDALKRMPPAVGVDLLFVDGEDYGPSFDPGQDQDVLLGSRHFAEHLPSAGYAPLYGVLFDMIGDSELQILQEPNSLQAAPEVVRRVWECARGLGYDRYFVAQEMRSAIIDDHVPLIAKGLRVIDVIDYEYPRPGATTYHHTPRDTFDKVSAQSLQVVGDVALSLISGRC